MGPGAAARLRADRSALVTGVSRDRAEGGSFAGRDAGIDVGEVDAPATYGLRQRILRPHQSLAEVAFANDRSPGAVHLAATDGEGTVVGVASLLEEVTPLGEAAWRLRGMAVLDGHRGRGVGSALFAAVEQAVAGRGGGVLWCAARLSAEPFYLRHGMERIGEEWDEPVIGRHVAMVLHVPAGR